MGRASNFYPTVIERPPNNNNPPNNEGPNVDRGQEHVFCEDNFVRTKRYIMQIEGTNNAIIDIWRLSSTLYDINQQIERMVLNLKAHFKRLDSVIKKAKSYYHSISKSSSSSPCDPLRDDIAWEFNQANENYQVFARDTSAVIRGLYDKLYSIRKFARHYTKYCEVTFTDVCDGCCGSSISQNNPTLENCFSYSYPEFVKILFELSFCKSESLDCIAKSERYLISLRAVLEMMR